MTLKTSWFSFSSAQSRWSSLTFLCQRRCFIFIKFAWLVIKINIETDSTTGSSGFVNFSFEKFIKIHSQIFFANNKLKWSLEAFMEYYTTISNLKSRHSIRCFALNGEYWIQCESRCEQWFCRVTHTHTFLLFNLRVKKSSTWKNAWSSLLKCRSYYATWQQFLNLANSVDSFTFQNDFVQNQSKPD